MRDSLEAGEKRIESGKKSHTHTHTHICMCVFIACHPKLEHKLQWTAISGLSDHCYMPSVSMYTWHAGWMLGGDAGKMSEYRHE